MTDIAARAGTLEKTELTLGFVPLVDAAPLVVAREKGFFAAEGLSVRLVREASWAALRDRVCSGVFDGGHMLAAIPVANAFALGGWRVPLVAPMALNLNGNAVTLSVSLWDELAAEDSSVRAGDLSVPRALVRLARHRRAAGRPLPRFGVVFPHSSHNYLLRYWLAAGGIDPDRDVRLEVVPPPQMIAYLTAGRIDGYCVGAPWSELAEAHGVGRIAALGHDIWNNTLDKVLGVTAAWAARRPATLRALLRALLRAGAWLDHPANRAEAAYWMARPEILHVPEAVVDRALRDVGDGTSGGLLFHRHAATFPWASRGLWTLSQMQRWGQVGAGVAPAAAASVYDSTIYRLAAADLGLPIPAVDFKRDGEHAEPWSAAAVDGGAIMLGADRFCDGRIFDPAQFDAYLAGFGIGKDVNSASAREAASS
ncbi:CmpA/NrtA family ABC transporter substrate-binding protein [Reyranella sp. CPCC 100927]|uniref:CmpA/NrtA family ABC transporter substrate-binding protein n=1 Tax=Reyranella sp. CPCC 100927 TaxID=2599616 RepID=UPI0011B4F0E3|nr:CmpA/NrtA family ABC transporter substrate-binding protein [Reyranella sp. CPCC 100927]TWT02074.1 ABC transporter substrate-binding protein [Reyranella sp. CPCC 100927]